MQTAEFPDRDKAYLIVQLLLDLVQQCFALLAVPLLGLLGVPGVDLRVFHPRLRSLAHYEGFKARGGAAKGTTALQRQGLVRLLAMRRLIGSTLHGPHCCTNARSRQVVHQRLTEAREADVDRTVAGVQAMRIAGFS